MKRYNSTIFGMVEEIYGDYCLYAETENFRNLFSPKERHERELYNKQRIIDSSMDKIIELTNNIDKKNGIINSILDLLTENLDRYEKDALTKKLYGVKPDSSYTTISMARDNVTEVSQECQSI